jgi:hypothetical protein
LAPESSEIDRDSLIEKFRIEITSAVEEDKANGRTLTLTPIRYDSNCNIDSQISELESMIRKLQDEISELYINADEEKEYSPEGYEDIDAKDSSGTIVIEKNSNTANWDEDIEKSEHNLENDAFNNEKFSHVFPLIVRDIMLPLSSSKGLDDARHLMNDKEETFASFDKIRDYKREVFDLQRLKGFASDGNFERLIFELQEINEQLELPYDVSSKDSSSDSLQDT